jgi:hypothetical protein
MKIMVNDKLVVSLNETQERVIKDEIPDEIFEDDMSRRVEWVISHKRQNCFKRLKDFWEPKLKAAGVKYIPTDDDEFAQLVFSQPDYASRSQREAQVLKK